MVSLIFGMGSSWLEARRFTAAVNATLCTEKCAVTNMVPLFPNFFGTFRLDLR
jgi:hypothetical protein